MEEPEKYHAEARVDVASKDAENEPLMTSMEWKIGQTIHYIQLSNQLEGLETEMEPAVRGSKEDLPQWERMFLVSANSVCQRSHTGILITMC